MFSQIKAVIYDMDGLLLNTEIFYSQAANAVVSRHGKSFNNDLKSRIVGRPTVESATLLVNELQLPISPEDYLKQRNKILKDLMPDAQPMPGAKELTQFLHSKQIKQAVATSTQTPFFELKTKSHQDWFSIFDAIICGDHPDIVNGKPAPDIFLIAAKQLNMAPEACLVFEDAPAGVEAAKSANMPVVAVLEDYANPQHYTKADQILHSLHEFDTTQWSLPKQFNKD